MINLCIKKRNRNISGKRSMLHCPNPVVSCNQVVMGYRSIVTVTADSFIHIYSIVKQSSISYTVERMETYVAVFSFELTETVTVSDKGRSCNKLHQTYCLHFL